MTIDKTAIRNAATVIVLRDRFRAPSILMGQRGAQAAFMPNKFVFPGGAVDPQDAHVPLHAPVGPLCHARLADDSPADMQTRLTAAAIRELWEETGLILGQAGPWPGDIPQDWHSFAATGHVPSAGALQFVFRALTPPDVHGVLMRGSSLSMPRKFEMTRMISRPPRTNSAICNGCL